ncbi:hypothetical protein B0A48_01631 [Cryoendolithus antarcticus]|uniref:GH64 domain-containing protein n=1 Tax=Cryoendolithus antarcticus TaxID=1507870 RepID=A0A1V8TPT6_9PEZI|nr:hypothetical protein B0A48_01631 [Cryoendolithus antarcticus]
MAPTLEKAFDLRVYLDKDNAVRLGTIKGGPQRTYAPVGSGEYLRGSGVDAEIIPKGADSVLVDMASGTAHLDVRCAFRSKEGDNFYLYYTGIVRLDEKLGLLFTFSPEVETTKSSDHYFVTTPTIEASNEEHKWMERTIFVSHGHVYVEGDRLAVEYEMYKNSNTPSTQQPTNQQQPAVGQAQQPLVTQNRAATAAAASTSPTLQIQLQNQTKSNQVWAYITGQALDNNNALFLLQSDARTPYYPPSPSSTGQPLNANCAIPLGGPGNTVNATIPRIAGGRIWFSQDATLKFFVNPGPGLVEPSIFNPADPNINTNFAFCEFTYNQYELFANISYVDFVSALPIALTVKDNSGATRHVSGMGPNGLTQVAQGLQAQTAKDTRRWSSLIVSRNNQPLRILSPNSGILLNPSWFGTYWNAYVDQVYAQYSTKPYTINTQAQFGNVTGQVSNNNFKFGNSTFAKPSAKDIFGCNTGPFATGSNTETNVIIPRLSAAFNRSTLLLSNSYPNSVQPAQYYQNQTTNHYARLVHAANLDGHGYAFPYDDVTPDGGVGQEGSISSGSTASFLVAVGGNNAYAA